MEDGQIVEKDGRKYRVNLERDDSADAPWDREDGHGEVSKWTSRDKRPGERILHEDRGSRRYYDFQAAVKTARVDGWDAPSYGMGTAKQQAARAAEADFKCLRGWCNDEWQYIGVIVTPLCPCCGEGKTDYRFALWGIESDAGDYLDEVARELIEEAETESPLTCEAAES